MTQAVQIGFIAADVDSNTVEPTKIGGSFARFAYCRRLTRVALCPFWTAIIGCGNFIAPRALHWWILTL
jgi:hypothetical protein